MLHWCGTWKRKKSSQFSVLRFASVVGHQLIASKISPLVLQDYISSSHLASAWGCGRTTKQRLSSGTQFSAQVWSEAWGWSPRSEPNDPLGTVLNHKTDWWYCPGIYFVHKQDEQGHFRRYTVRVCMPRWHRMLSCYHGGGGGRCRGHDTDSRSKGRLTTQNCQWIMTVPPFFQCGTQTCDGQNASSQVLAPYLHIKKEKLDRHPKNRLAVFWTQPGSAQP